MDYILQSRELRFQPPNQNKPTVAQPGSREKLLVMTERYRTGQALHHPRDANCLDQRERGKGKYLDMFYLRMKRQS